MIVVAILAVLGIQTIDTWENYQEKARTAEAIAMLQEIQDEHGSARVRAGSESESA